MPSNDSSFWPLVILQLLSASVLLGLIFAAPGPWDLQRLGGAILAFVSLCLLGVSRFQLGRSFSVTPQARALVTRGIYSRIRNPIYVFSGLMIAGIILVLRRPVLWFFLALLIPIQIVRAKREARVLQEHFGEEYRAYRSQTWF